MSSDDNSKRCTVAEVSYVFDLLKDSKGVVYFKYIVERLEQEGILEDDIRLQKVIELLPEILGYPSKNINEVALETSELMRIISQQWPLFFKALTQSLVIPKFDQFSCIIANLHDELLYEQTGETSDYIPELKNTCPDLWAVSICTIDGQRCSFGDSAVPLTIQDISYPFLFAKCLDTYGLATVLKYVRLERKPVPLAVKNLNANNKPYNPMTDSGALSLSTLFCDNDKRSGSTADKHHEFFEYMKDMCCNHHIQICTPAYISAREKDDLSRAIAYSLVTQECIPKDTDIPTIMDFFYEIRSLEVTSESLAIMAATLANFGENPYTNEKIMNPLTVKSALSAMHNWGCYNLSGYVAFHLGMPCKHNVSGALMLIVPGSLGLVLYSPRLNEEQVSQKNLDFAMEFLKKFDLHPYIKTVEQIRKRFPTRKIPDVQCENYCPIFTAVFNNDMLKVMSLTNANKEIIYEKDLEGRTVLHLAAAKGHKDIIKFITPSFRKLCSVKDRFGRLPRDYVKVSDKNFAEITNILKSWEEMDASCE